MKNWVEEYVSSTQFFYCPCLFGGNGFHVVLLLLVFDDIVLNECFVCCG